MSIIVRIVVIVIFLYNLPSRIFAGPGTGEKYASLGAYYESYFNYFEAITEYRRAYFVSRDTRYLMKAASLYQLSSNHSAAEKLFLKAEQAELNERQKSIIHLHILDARYKQGSLSLSDLQEFKKNYDIPGNIDENLRLNTLRFLLKNHRKKAASQMLPYVNKKKYDYQLLQEHLNTRPRNISSGALVFSAFPGGFFYYSGKYKRGILATTTVSLLTAGSVFAATAGATVAAVLSGIFALRFYSSSISESARQRIYLNQEYEKFYFRRALELSGGEPDFPGRF